MGFERDAEIVSWIGRLGAAGREHVMARFAPGDSPGWGYEQLRALAQDGLLAPHRILYRRPTLYVATARGLRWRSLNGLGVCKISAATFEHAWQIADAAVTLAAGLPDWKILSDRELLWHERQRSELIASARVGTRRGRTALHRPDPVLLSPEGRVVAIEVELSVKGSSELTAICNGWARARHVDAVYYLATPAVTRALARTAKKTRAEDCLRILPLGQTEEVVRLEREAL